MNLKQQPFAILLILYFLITIGYSITTPLFETPDEYFHFFTTLSIKETGRLPVSDPTSPALAQQEAAQPPLYYLITALLISPFDTTAATTEFHLNPRAVIGDSSQQTNKNVAFHSPDEQFPWHGYIAAAHLLRLFSVILGAATLTFIYLSIQLIWPNKNEIPLLAVALISFLPQFNFLHASISNDSLIIFFATLTLYLLIRLPQNAHPKQLLFLGSIIGLAMLTKLTGALLLLYTALIFLSRSWEKRALKPLIQSAVYIALPALLISGSLFYRNLILYGDPTATNQFIAFAGGDRHYTLLQVLAESSGLFHSIFAVFGWFNLQPPTPIYFIWYLIIITALLPLLRLRPQINKLYLLPGIWFFFVYIALIQFMKQTPAAQGRLLFPALLPMILPVAYGLSHWSKKIQYALLFLACFSTLYCGFYLIPKTYAYPPTISFAQLPPTAVLLNHPLAPGLFLVAIDPPPPAAHPNDSLPLTLFWKRTAGSETTFSSPTSSEYVLELLGTDQELLGKSQTYPGNGLFPATYWPIDQIIVDHTTIAIENGTMPTRLTWFLKLIDYPDNNIEIAQSKLVPPDFPLFSPPLAQFGSGIELADYQIDYLPETNSVQINLTWQITQPPNQPLTTLIHLGPIGQPPILQADGIARNGNYPTQFWSSGERFTDQYELFLPAEGINGRFPLQIGFYNPDNWERLPVSVNGLPQPHNSFILDWIELP